MCANAGVLRRLRGAASSGLRKMNSSRASDFCENILIPVHVFSLLVLGACECCVLRFVCACVCACFGLCVLEFVRFRSCVSVYSVHEFFRKYIFPRSLKRFHILSWKPPVVHRDLKSLNLLVDKHWTVKVGGRCSLFLKYILLLVHKPPILKGQRGKHTFS